VIVYETTFPDTKMYNCVLDNIGIKRDLMLTFNKENYNKETVERKK